MGNGAFAQVLAAAGVGMAIVFAFLSLLSLLMLAIRAGDAVGRATDASAARAPDAPRAAAGRASAGPARRDLPPWVIAAAVAYLAREREMEARTAKGWVSARTRREP